MIPAIDQSIWSQIIQALLTEPGLSAEELRKRVSLARKESVTIQGIYKDLRRLQALGVVYKGRAQFYLSLSWLLDSRDALDQGVKAYSRSTVLARFFPQVGESQSWSFSDIHAMDRFVANLILALQLHGQSTASFHWVPYPWFAAFYPNRVQPFLKEFRKRNLTAYGVLGVDSLLSREVVAAQKAYGHNWWIGKPPFRHSESTSLSVKPPYIVSVRYPKKALEVFRKFFALKKIPPPASYAPFHDLALQRLTYRVTIAHKPTQAESFAEECAALFL